MWRGNQGVSESDALEVVQEPIPAVAMLMPEFRDGPTRGRGHDAGQHLPPGNVRYETATGRDRHECPTLPLEREDLEKSSGLLELNSLWLKARATQPAERNASADALATLTDRIAP